MSRHRLTPSSPSSKAYRNVCPRSTLTSSVSNRPGPGSQPSNSVIERLASFALLTNGECQPLAKLARELRTQNSLGARPAPHSKPRAPFVAATFDLHDSTTRLNS